ncbi:protein MpTRIHELIX13 [Marchantia polymorpha subsp. ruderalis]|nr:hypothetical protein MARPO_0032s0097 [Marchantia polymorpha]PTQ41912.1 hypothetical protein MARPO_0032s0097 [Marchantia polymorpha]BBN11697.1 hypothetical protein Mp_5g14070 [Marchantia polymorpha subsp. ruderalis]BBN11698.1 hypothetical protein Mp_5g14070 [Marchantia polymorpha subsp. ruderalis]|eukprot:PTQ41911.1 hypothetical protein MARPO_0032s0097 [Marchantia polymorpha]
MVAPVGGPTVAMAAGSRKSGRPDEEPERAQKQKTKVVVEFSLVFKRGCREEQSRGPAGAKILHETLFIKTQKRLDDEGNVLDSQIVEESSWSTAEVEYLIMLRSKGDSLFCRALKEKKLGLVWQKAALGLSRVARTEKDAKQCQWMWYMLMKEYNSVLQGAQNTDGFPFFAQMQETRKYRTPIDIPGRN